MNDLLLPIRKFQGQGGLNQPEFIAEYEKQIDQSLGIQFRYIPTEEELLYGDLEQAALSTSYLDFDQIFNYCEKLNIKHFADLGAGYGRSARLAYEQRRPFAVSAIEYCEERVNKGWMQGNYKFYQGDITQNIPQAEAYFLYLPEGRLIYESLSRIDEAYIFVIESHGGLVDEIRLWGCDLIDSSMNVSLPRHDDKIYVFKKHSHLPNSKLFELYKNVMINSGSIEVNEEIKGMLVQWKQSLVNSEFSFINHRPYLELKNPVRTLNLISDDWIYLNEIVKGRVYLS